MPYVRLWVHLNWSTKIRAPSMGKQVKAAIFSHIQENAKKKEIALDTINGSFDHVHALVLLKADQSVSKVAQLHKGESSHWINDEQVLPTRFEWQDEYCALSVSECEVAVVREYIRNQEEHHRQKTYAQEFEYLLRANSIDLGLKPGGV